MVGKDQSQTEFAGLGQTGGAKTHTLTTPEIPSHTHNGTFGDFTGSAGAAVYSGANRTANSIATDATGGGGAHNNLQPYVTLNYIIKT
jgi:microcystin-dependent protein